MDEAFRAKRDGGAVKVPRPTPHCCPKQSNRLRRPDYREKIMGATLFLFLAAVLLSSLVVGFGELNRTYRSRSALAVPSPPVARAELIELIGQPSDHAQ
jgi:hypothetical protein